MEDRRCRLVMALLMTTVIILSAFVQSAYAGPEKSTERLYNRVLDFKQMFLGVNVVKENILVQVQENKIVKAIANKLSEGHRNETRLDDGEIRIDDIVVVIEQVPPEEVNKTSTKLVAAVEKEQDVKSATFSRSLGVEIMREDIDLLARIIHAEARGESFEGQVAVGAVVLNRVQHPSFPKTIKDVIYQPGQFTAVDDRQIELPPNQNAYLAAQAALEGQDPSNGAIYYYNPKIATDKWIRTRNIIRTIGNHLFCV